MIDENARREMEPLVMHQSQWETLKAILRREMTMAFAASADARQPRLKFHTELRTAVETVKAAIGLAETTLVVDGAGAYRGRQILRMNNATEQFLEIRLPEGGRLWTARVAGEPVKPTAIPGSTDPRDVRIPLIKTAPGELYYEVVLKYGGRLPTMAAWGAAAFPLVRCRNVAPDLSQVRLYLPEEYRWFDFGGTMRLVHEEANLQADYLQFQTGQTVQIGIALHGGDKWTRARAAANLKAQQSELSSYRASLSSESAANPELQSQLAINDRAMQQIQREAAKSEKSPDAADVQYNRRRLNEAFQQQKYEYGAGRNAVAEAGQNFADLPESNKDGEKKKKESPSSLGRDYRGEAQRFQNEPSRPGEKSPAFGRKTQSLTMMTTPRIVIQEEEEEKLGVAPADKDAKGGEGKTDALKRYEVQLEQQVKQQSQMYRNAGSPSSNQQMPQVGVGVNSDSGLVGSTILGGRGMPRDGNGFDPFASPSSPPGMPRLADESSPLNAASPPVQSPANQSPTDSTVPVQPQPPMKRIAGPENPSTAAPSYTVSKPGYETKAQSAAGLASLDFELPTHGVLYRFTTPRGEVEITARHVSDNLVQRLLGIVETLAVLLVLWLAVRLIGRARPAQSDRRAVVDCRRFDFALRRLMADRGPCRDPLRLRLGGASAHATGLTDTGSLRAGESISGGLSQFSFDENGTVPLRNALK